MKTRIILAAALVCVLAFTATIVHAVDAIPSWNEGNAKQAIQDFVAKVTTGA